MYFNEPAGRDKTPGKENPKNPFRKKKTGYIFPEPVRCHLPFEFLSPLNGTQSQNENEINNSLRSRSKIYMNIFREEFVSNIRKT